MHAEVQGGRGLGHELLDVAGAVLVRRRDDLDEGDEAVAADVANGQRAAAAQRRRFDRVPAPRPRRRVGQGDSAGRRGQRQRAGVRLRVGRAGVQRQHVRDGAAGVLFGQGIVALRQQAAVEGLLDLRDPGDVKSMKDPGVNAGPIVQRHGGSSHQLIVPAKEAWPEPGRHRFLLFPKPRHFSGGGRKKAHRLRISESTHCVWRSHVI